MINLSDELPGQSDKAGGGEGSHARVEKASADESRRLVEETGIDTLAPAVGSVHGSSSRLDLPLSEAIAGVTTAPLVLHGGSGIHPDDLREALQLNVVKVNIGADVFGPGWPDCRKERR